MKHILKNGWKGLLLVTFPALFTACEDDEFTKLSTSEFAKVVEMIIPEQQQSLLYTDESGTQVLPLIKGESISLGATIKPETTTYKDVVWSSSNEAVATVDENGMLHAVSGDGIGYAIITLSPYGAYSGSGIPATLKVVVSNSLVKAESLSMSASSSEVYAGETVQCTVGILPDNATYKTVKWTSSNEQVATVDKNGLVIGKVSSSNRATVTITATALDGSNLSASQEITVLQVVQPKEISIAQDYSADNGYLVAIADKTVTLNYTTVPDDCTKSLIEWSSSDETIATVDGGVVTINQDGVFGKVTITGVCPETGSTSSIALQVEEGLVRELFHDPNNITWNHNNQSGNGTSTSSVWEYGKLTVTTYTQNATKQRADFKCKSAKTWIHAGKYPFVAIRLEDVKVKYGASRNINLDTSGSCNGTDYKGNVGGSNNKYAHEILCSDGSSVLVYDLSTQKFATGGLLPTDQVASFATFQFKYADMATLTEQVTYAVYWVQTFPSLEAVKAYITSEGLTFE